MNLKIGKLKVIFFMSSGQNVIIKCESFEITKLSSSKGNRELTIEGADRKWSIDVEEIVAVTSKRCWF
jgi:hypothetical protein